MTNYGAFMFLISSAIIVWTGAMILHLVLA